MGTKKRQRSESFQAEQNGDGNARKRLANFHARMFELPFEDSLVVVPTTPRVLLKATLKTKVAGGDDADDREAVPMVRFNMKKKKKEKKKVGRDAEVKKEKKMKKTLVMDQTVVLKSSAMSKTKVVAPITTNKAQKKKNKKAVVPAVAVRPSMQTDNVGDDDGVDLLEQALRSMKEIVTIQADKSLHKKHNTVLEESDAVPKVEKLKQKVEAAEKKDTVIHTVAGDASHSEPPKKHTKSEKKRNKKLRKQAAKKAKDNKLAPDDLAVIVDHDETSFDGVSEKVDVSTRENGSTATKSTARLPKSRVKRKKSPMVTTTKKSQAPVQSRQDKPLVISETSEKRPVSNGAKYADKAAPKTAEGAPGKKARIGCKPAVPLSTKADSSDKKKTAASLKPSTPIAATLTKVAKKKNGMFLSTQEELVKKAAVLQVTDEVLSESEDNGVFELDHSHGDNTSLFSRLIDSAARERWELVEVGRLVRLFAAEWDYERRKTARFLCKTCPELVNVDFLEGLGVNLSAKQLIKVFAAGSGSSRVLMNKMASAVENGRLSVRDPNFVLALEERVTLLELNAEVMELLHPLLESLSTVRDVGYLLKQLCEHWQLERKIALVQQVLLSNVFDDLDGNQDEILLDLPDLTGQLDFPSRLDQEDVDENGNLKGFLADDDSDSSGEEGSEEDVDEVDSEDDEGLYEGDTNSEEEVEISSRSRGRNQFIEDEADVGDEDEVEEEERHDDDASPSSISD